MTDLPDLSAPEVLRRFRDGRLRAPDYAEALIERATAREPVVRAFAWRDDAALRAAARAPLAGPLGGLPMGVKDVLDTAGVPTGAGSPAWDGNLPRADAAAVAMARAAGAILAGKTVTTEFATRHPGPTTNPHDVTRTPGGSSQGSAAGVAAGFFPVAFGTQTGGSVIRPAAFCGVVGFKPSWGLIHRGGMRVMSETLDTIGTMARDVAGCALLAEAASGEPLGDPEAALAAPPRVGFCLGPAAEHLSVDTVALLHDAAARIARAGARVTEMAALPESLLPAVEAHPVVMHRESLHALAWELAAVPEKLSPVLRDTMGWAAALPAGALPAGRETLHGARRAFAAIMGEHDVLLTASALGEAPLGLQSTGDPAANALWTALHGPCVTLPAGTGRAGMPLGVQLVGVAGDDARVLRCAAWVRAALG